MEEIKIKANVINREFTEEDLKRIREEAKKARRPSAARMADEIGRLVKKTTDPDDPTEAKYARALIGVFLKELTAHKQGKHVEVAQRLQAEMKEKRPLHLKQDSALALATAAIRYDISFGRVAMH